jgi:hypothetical protein
MFCTLKVLKTFTFFTGIYRMYTHMYIDPNHQLQAVKMTYEANNIRHNFILASHEDHYLSCFHGENNYALFDPIAFPYSSGFENTNVVDNGYNTHMCPKCTINVHNIHNIHNIHNTDEDGENKLDYNPNNHNEEHHRPSPIIPVYKPVKPTSRPVVSPTPRPSTSPTPTSTPITSEEDDIDVINPQNVTNVNRNVTYMNGNETNITNITNITNVTNVTNVTNATNVQDNQPTSSLLDVTYLGCIKSPKHVHYNIWPQGVTTTYDDTNVTIIEACSNSCQDLSEYNQYIGIDSGTECWCGSRQPTIENRRLQCIPCRDTDAYTCGNVNYGFVSVYKLNGVSKRPTKKPFIMWKMM